MAKKTEIKKEEVGAIAVEAKSQKVAHEHGHDESEFEMVQIEIPVYIKLGKLRMAPGVHKVQRHQARDIMSMARKKMKADLQALSVTSKSYLVNRALTGAINVKEVSEIKF